MMFGSARVKVRRRPDRVRRRLGLRLDGNQIGLGLDAD